MGSNKGNPDELPVHEEVITTPFYLGIYEVTQEQWQNIIGDKLPNRSAHKDPTNLRLPMEYLSLAKARAFCEQLSGKEGRLCRLPTEVEWEYACRAGSTMAYCSGESSDDLAKVAWYADNAGEPDARGWPEAAERVGPLRQCTATSGNGVRRAISTAMTGT